jgi:death on curing protein
MTSKVRKARPRQMATVPVSGLLSVEDVCLIHQRLCEDFAVTKDPINPPGVRSQALLESAVARQDTGWAGSLKYPTALTNAASLAFGLCKDHPFHNGNKRTALVAMLAHLDKNRLTICDVKQTALFDLMLDIAQMQLSLRGIDPRSKKAQRRPPADEEVEAISEWLARNTRSVTRGERDMTFRQLRAVLRRFNYDFDHPRNNSIDVVRLAECKRGLVKRETVIEKKSIGNIPYPGESKLVGIKKIKQVRQMCRLTEEGGTDSAAFYDGTDVLDVFINQYRTVLRRLAKR